MADRIEHPDEATWERLAHGEMAAPERDALFDHITACEACSRAWRGVLTLHREAQDQGLIPREAPAGAGWLWSRAGYLAVAATLVAAVGGVILNRQTGADLSGDRSAMRSTGAAAVEGLSATPAGGTITFSWTPQPGTSSYRVSVFSEEGLPVWTRETERPPLAWPAEAGQTAGVYRWRVEALSDGLVRASSRLSVVEVGR